MIITTVIAVNTIDEVIARALESRLKNESELLDLLGDYLKRKQPQHSLSIEERIKAARKRLQETHPDKGGTVEAFHEALAEFDHLKKEVA